MFREDYSDLEHLGYVVWEGDFRPESCRMAMLTAYFDESRMDDGKPFPVIAGYLSTVSNWVGLTAQWRHALAEAGLKSFHTKDCWANKREFVDSKKWNKAAKEQLVHLLLDIIRDHVAVAIVTTIDNEAFMEMCQTHGGKIPRHGSQYELCGFSSSVLLGKWMGRHSNYVNPVSVVFDEGNDYRHNFELSYNLVKFGPFPFAGYLGPITFASDTRLVPLQAADLLAWTMSRTIEDGLVKDSPPSVPWAHRIWHEVPREENYIKRSTLEKMKATGIWNPELQLNAKDVGRFVKLIKKANNPWGLS